MWANIRQDREYGWEASLGWGEVMNPDLLSVGRLWPAGP